MKVIKCDICGRETNNNETYIFPMWLDIHGGLRNPVIASKVGISKCEANLCNKCKRKIADMIYEIRNN